MKKNRRTYLVVSFSILMFNGMGQVTSIALDDCQELAMQNYPTVKSYELIKQSGEFSISNAKSGFLPAISINGQYTYQSDVTKLPIELPNIAIPEISKDQYKVYGEVSQVLYDGGATRNKKDAAIAQSAIEEESLTTELYNIRERVNEIYFGILLLDRQIEQNKLMKQDIKAGLEKIEAAYANGTVLKSNVDAVKAEIVKAGQREIELTAARRSYIKMLSMYVNKELDDKTELQVPPQISINDKIVRPELDLFDARMHGIEVQTSLISSKNLPRLNVFIQGGYGSPALNMLNPDADTWYLAGVRFSYPLNGFYTMKKEKLINEISKKNISFQKDAFIFNTHLQTERQKIEVAKMQDLIKTDEEIVEMRKSVKESSLVQLENGVITSSDYIREVIALDQAVQSRLLHEIQLLLAQYNHQLITGN